MGDPGSTAAFYPSRPTLTVAGSENGRLSLGLLSLLVEETTEGLFRCEANFGNWGTAPGGEVGFLYFDRQTLDFGSDFEVQMGNGEARAKVFEGRVTGVEGRFPRQRPPEITVLAEDRFQDLRMVRRTRTFEDVSDRDVIEQVASNHGLQPELDIDGPTYRTLAQVNQSDLAFLRERARSVDAELWMDGRTLHAQARGRRRGADVTLTYGQGLQEFSVLADLASQRTSLSVAGWDVQSKEAIDIEATGSAIQNELNGDVSGGETLQSSFGSRAERIVHLVPLSSAEARALAEAHYRRLSRRFVSGHGVAEGDARVRVGAHVELNGLGDLFSGRYFVTEARHSFDSDNGYRTHFRAERAGMGQA